MSHHSEPQPQELRQSLLSELETSQQAIAELSDEELEQVAGGRIGRIGKLAIAGIVGGTLWHLYKNQQNQQSSQYDQGNQ
jgi:hypothetical protein